MVGVLIVWFTGLGGVGGVGYVVEYGWGGVSGVGALGDYFSAPLHHWTINPQHITQRFLKRTHKTNKKWNPKDV